MTPTGFEPVDPGHAELPQLVDATPVTDGDAATENPNRSENRTIPHSETGVSGPSSQPTANLTEAEHPDPATDAGVTADRVDLAAVPTDPDLAAVLTAWATLSEPVKTAILHLVRASVNPVEGRR